MPDREKVIKALEFCESSRGYDCDGCPYDGECANRLCAVDDDALALLREQEPNKWISVKDRLPESDKEVLVAVYDSDGQAYHTIAVHYPCGGWDSDDDYFNMNEDEVMYWMPLPTLPEPPEEVTGDADEGI